MTKQDGQKKKKEEKERSRKKNIATSVFKYFLKHNLHRHMYTLGSRV